MNKLRAIVILTTFALSTLPAMPLQAVLLKLHVPSARSFAHVYYKWVVTLLGVKIDSNGPELPGGACLIVANHVSWYDIMILGAVFKTGFVAKSEVAGWPFFGMLAKLAGTIFVDRNNRHRSSHSRDEIAARLENGEKLVLFAEGTSTIGTTVLPFKSALFEAACVGEDSRVPVVPVTLAYTRRHGVPLGDHMRPSIAWYGDMDLAPHLFESLARGPLDVVVKTHSPLTGEETADRKHVARHAENTIRDSLHAILRGRGAEH